METWCSDLVAILDAEGYSKAVVAGHCLGANLAVRFASSHPGRTAGLILIEPMPPQALTGSMRKYQPLRPFFALLIRVIRLVNRLGLYRRRIATLDLRELDRATRAAMTAQGSAQALLRRYAAPWHDLRYLPSANYFQEFLEVSRPYPPLAEIGTPVLALLSSGGLLTDPRITCTVLSELPNCRITILEARHWIPTEKPDGMKQAVEQWCREIERA